ncbi:MAG: TolC family protein [Salinibacter sp.]
MGPGQAQPAPLPDTLTFEDATGLLLENNPDLRAARARVQADSKTAQEAALFPNPTLEGANEHTRRPDGTGADDEWYLTLSQPLNYPGEQRARQQSADAAERAAEAQLQETRAALYETLRQRYLGVVVADTRYRLLRRYADAIRQAGRAATARYEEGDLSPVRRSRLKNAEAAVESDLSEARRERRTARRELAYMLFPDRPLNADTARVDVSRFSVPDALGFRAVSVDTQAALAMANEQRAGLRAQQARVERQRHALDAARYQRAPDLQLSAGPKQLSTPGGSTLGFTAGLQVELPLWNGGRTAVEAQEGRRAEAEATLDATRRAVEADVLEALDRIDNYQSRLQATADAAQPGPDTTLEDALFVYEQGELTLFELLDTVEAALQTERRRVRRTAQFLRALYALEASLGVGPQDAPVVVEGALSPRDADL